MYFILLKTSIHPRYFDAKIKSMLSNYNMTDISNDNKYYWRPCISFFNLLLITNRLLSTRVFFYMYQQHISTNLHVGTENAHYAEEYTSDCLHKG